MKKRLLIGITAGALAAILAWKLRPHLGRTVDLDGGPAVGVGPGGAVDGVGKVTANGPGREGGGAPSVGANAPGDPARAEDPELLEQEKRIAKLRKLNELVDGKGYRVEHLEDTLSSDEGMWLKAAYLQGALDSRWTGAEADQALAEALGFLSGLDPATNPDTMAVRAYHTAMQLMADLNRRGGAKYDVALKERYEATRNPDYLKTIVDTGYKLEKIRTVPPHHAVAIVRESPTGEYVGYAKTLLGEPGITAEDRGDLNKYLAQHGGKSDWKTSPSDDSKTKLMKLNGVASSKAGGKSEYIYRQWLDLFFSKITDDISYSDWRALPNPSHELAQALWTEEDRGVRARVEGEILELLKRHGIGGKGEQDQRMQRALVNLAVAYLDLCLSNLAPRECRDDLASTKSFGYVVARDHLAAYLGRPDAAMALGTAKAYVEKVAGDAAER